MSTGSKPLVGRALRLHRALDAVWSAPKGWWGVRVSVNHTDTGRRFILTAFFFFAVGGLLAMLICTQLATPGSAFVGPSVYNQLFTMHGTFMMLLFLFAIPMFEGLSLYLLPKMLGARDLAFPRLSSFVGGATSSAARSCCWRCWCCWPGWRRTTAGSCTHRCRRACIRRASMQTSGRSA